MIPVKRVARHRLVISIATLGASLALAGCGSAASTPGEVQVVGAEVQYGDLLAQIGGTFVHVTSVMSNPNVDPHNFEASPRVAQAIAGAQLVVQNGAGYDAFMNQLESASPSSNRRVVSVSSVAGAAAPVNPHFWYSPTTIRALSQVVTLDLVKISPSHATYFRARETAFLSSWQRVFGALDRARRQFAQRRVATTEPVGDYLLSAMGLDNRTPFRFQADVMNGIDPSPEDIVTQENLLNRHLVGALCFNAQVSSPVTSALRHLAARDHVALVALYETMPAGQHLQSWMLDEISAITAALSRGTSTVSLR